MKTSLVGGGVGRDLTNHAVEIVWITVDAHHRGVSVGDHQKDRAEGSSEVESGMNENWRDECLTPFVERSEKQTNHNRNASVR